MNNKFFFQKGQSLFELILAIGVSAVVIVVLVSLVNNALQAATFAKNQSKATGYAREATEWLRSERDRDIVSFLNNTTPSPTTWCFRDSPLTVSSWNLNSACSASNVITGSGIFTRQATFTIIPSTKTIIQAQVRVNWTDSKGTHTVESITRFADWRER